MAFYELWYEGVDGTRIAPIVSFSSLEYTLVQGDIGVARVGLSATNRGVSTQQLWALSNRPDLRLTIYRHTNRASLEMICFLRLFGLATDGAGLTTLTLGGSDANELLARRIVAYYAEESQSKKTDEADDMMKAIVRENLGSSSGTDYDGNAVTGRDLSDQNFAVQANRSLGPSITKSFDWKNVLEVLQDIQATSRTEENEVFFGIVPSSNTDLTFVTKTDQWGQDRTVGTGKNPIVFSVESGNLTNPNLVRDYQDEKTFIYGLGQGELKSREIQEASDTVRIGRSKFGRIEAGTGATDQTTAAGVLSVARDELARRRPELNFTGTVISTPIIPYGGDGWRLGDKCTVDYQRQQIDVHIRAVHVKVEASGKESISARVESENA